MTKGETRFRCGAMTGLDYFEARHFNGAQGRFSSADPINANIIRVINPQRWNMYAYAVNNPEGQIVRVTGVNVAVSGDAHYTIASTPFTYPASDGEATMGWTREKFDRAGRVVEVEHYRGAVKPPPFGANTQVTGTRRIAYNGFTTQVTDEAGKVTSTVADALGRIASATNNAGTTDYSYNALDNLTWVTQSDAWTYGGQKTQTRVYDYNSLGWLLAATNPESGTVAYSYFANGALQTRSDARGVSLTNTLDALGRVTRADYSATDPVTPGLRFCYDGKEYDLASDNCVAVGGRGDHARGVLTHAVARKVVGGTPTLVSGTKYSSIDPLGRILDSRQTTGPHLDYTFLYQYAVGGALAKVRYPSGNWVSYDVNGANRISQVRKGETGSAFYMKNAAYNAAGALVGATLGLDGANQWTESRAYNSRLQARRVEVAQGANTLLRLRWAYAGSYNGTTFEETGADNNGDLRVERLEHLHQGALQSVDRAYTYSGADRLVGYSEPSKNQSFTYDAFGNVWQSSGSGVPALRQNGASWYLHNNGVVNNRLANTAYDAAGNQTQLSVASGTVASYDGENRMSKIAVSGAETASYTYDAEGRRVAKTANGVSTYYFYDAAGQLMAEYDGPAQTAGTHYFTTDYLGSTRMILSGTGACLERLDYAPFGGQISRAAECYGGTSSEKPLFTGQMRDGESTAGTDTGQDYFNARYLWANIARFTSPDAPFADQQPADGQSWNMYAYVRNNPLRYTDPSGQCFVEPETDSSVDDEGNACFEVDAPSDRPISSIFLPAIGEGVNRAKPVVNAIGETLLTGAELGTGFPIGFFAGFGGNDAASDPGAPSMGAVTRMGAESPRLAQDIRVNPVAPPASVSGSVGPNANQAARLARDLSALNNAPPETIADIRVNQQQVDTAMRRVGINRPDLQFTNLRSNQRYIIEYETNWLRGQWHRLRALTNDRSVKVIIRLVK